MNLQSRAALQSEINVTPLVDVCLVLLIIFMVVTPLIVTGMPVQLPHSSTAGAVGKTLTVTVMTDGTLYVGGAVVRRDELEGTLRRQRASNGDRPVAVRADKRLSYGDVVEVLDTCRAAGYTEVGLISTKAAR